MGRLGTSVSGPDGLFLPQTSQSEIGHETDAPEPRQDDHLVQIEVLWASQDHCWHDDGQAVTRDDPAVVQDPRTVEMGQ